MFLILMDKPKNCDTNKNGCIIPYHQHYIFLTYVSLKIESKNLKPWLECKNSIFLNRTVFLAVLLNWIVFLVVVLNWIVF